MPAEEQKAVSESLSYIDKLLNALANTEIENADASRKEDKKNALSFTEEEFGHLS